MTSMTDGGAMMMGEPPTPAFRKVRRASRWFAWLFTVLFFIVGVLVAVFACVSVLHPDPTLVVDMKAHTTSAAMHTDNSGLHLGFASIPPGKAPLGALPLAQRLGMALTALARAVPVMMIFWNLKALFGLYARGIVFSEDNSRRIKHVGAWLVAAAATPFVCHLLLSAVIPDLGPLWVHSEAVQELILGGLVFVIAQVMQVGREIEEDRSQFV